MSFSDPSNINETSARIMKSNKPRKNQQGYAGSTG